MSEGNEKSAHYLGEKGEAYYAAKLGPGYDLGRQWQTRYFRPYCSEQAVLLEFGCSDGRLVRSLPARRRIGIEINPAARAKCLEISARDHIEIEMHEDLESVGAESVDVAFSNHCLEHVLNPWHALKQLHRVLKQDGVFVLVIPYDDYRCAPNGHWAPGDPDNHIYTWSPMNIGNLLTEAGFDVQEVRLCISSWSPKFLPIKKLFGDFGYGVACYLNSLRKKRREIFCRARKKSAGRAVPS